MTPLLAWYDANARKLPWRETKDPYRIWVSEIMLQQTRVEAVIRYYRRFLERLPDVAALADCPETELLKLWEGLGYYSRARNMQKAARVIAEKYGGAFPKDFKEIRALPGIGEYTAGAIASFAFGLPVPAVDGNVMRVAARLAADREDILSPAARRAVTAAVAEAQPKERPGDFNQAAIELGALVCLPNAAPKCGECPLAAVCAARAQGVETELPVRRKAAPRKVEERTVLILREGDRVALCRRPAAGLLAGLFEPPCVPGRLRLDEVAGLLRLWGIAPLYLTPLEASAHLFTHIEWRMVGFEVILPDGTAAALQKKAANGAENFPFSLIFAPREEIDDRYALPSAYRAYRPYM